MSNQLIPFDAGGLPAHIASAFTAEEANTQGRPTIDQLSYRGKVWRLVLKGEEHVLTRPDPETGEIVPVQMVSLVVLDLNKARSRSYYEGAYEDGKNQAPICYSADGVTPDESVRDKQSPTCASCQWSVKGSRITESNKQTTACSPFKRIAVVPAQRIADHPVMLLRMAQTSVWDKDADGSDGWYAWDQYVDMLRARGANHTAAVETRVKFDMAVPYPKLMFSAKRWLDPQETAAAKARLADPVTTGAIKDILSGGNRDGVMGQPASPATRPTGQMQETKVNGSKQPATAPVDLSGLAPGDDATADATKVAKVATQANATVAAEAKLPPKVPKVPKAPAAAPAWPPAGWTVHPEDPNYFYKDDLVMGEEELRAHVAPPPPPPAPAAPKVPKTPAKPKVEKVKAEPVDDDGFGGVKQPPAAAATPVKETPVVSGTPSDLSTLLEGWDDN